MNPALVPLAPEQLSFSSPARPRLRSLRPSLLRFDVGNALLGHPMTERI
jgi:hypothetical protein